MKIRSWNRVLAMLLAVAMAVNSQSTMALAKVIGMRQGGVQQQETPGIGNPETFGDENAVLNTVTFVKMEGAVIKVGDEEIDNEGTAEAKDGTIIFSVFPEEGYEITRVLVDGEEEAEHTADEEGEENAYEYIIEHIQTDETIVSVETQAVETEKVSEAESGAQTPAETETQAVVGETVTEAETTVPAEQTEMAAQEETATEGVQTETAAETQIVAEEPVTEAAQTETETQTVAEEPVTESVQTEAVAEADTTLPAEQVTETEQTETETVTETQVVTEETATEGAQTEGVTEADALAPAEQVTEAEQTENETEMQTVAEEPVTENVQTEGVTEADTTAPAEQITETEQTETETEAVIETAQTEAAAEAAQTEEATEAPAQNPALTAGDMGMDGPSFDGQSIGGYSIGGSLPGTPIMRVPGSEEKSTEAPADQTEVETEAAQTEEVTEAATDVTAAADGSVTVSAAEGVLPAGTQVETAAADQDAAMDAVSAQLQQEDPELNLKDVYVADITLKDADGNAIQPNGDVTVTITGLTVPEGATWAAVYHIDADGAATKVADVVPAETVSFTASHFSTYAVAFGSKPAFTTPAQNQTPTAGDMGMDGLSFDGQIPVTTGTKNGMTTIDGIPQPIAAGMSPQTVYVYVAVEGDFRNVIGEPWNNAYGNNGITWVVVGKIDGVNLPDVNNWKQNKGKDYASTFGEENLKALLKNNLQRWTTRGSVPQNLNKLLDYYFEDIEVNYDGTGSKYGLYVTNTASGYSMPYGGNYWHLDLYLNVRPYENLAIEKKVINDENGTKKFKEGETVEFEITVTNKGTTTLSNIHVTDELSRAALKQGSGYTIQDGQAVIGTLNKGAIVTIKASYVVQKDDLGKGTITNHAVAKWGSNTVRGQDTFNVADGTINVTIQKNWDHKGADETDKKTEASFQLLRDGKLVGSPVTIHENNSYTWENQPIGNYSISEGSVDGYNSEISEPNVDDKGNITFTVTNTFTGKDIMADVAAMKKWAGVEEGNTLPDSVHLQIKEGTSVVAEGDVKAESEWKLTKELPKYDSNGNKIIYTADEESVPNGYEKTTDGLTVTNKYTGGETSVDVKKVWEPAGLEHDSVTVTLKNGDAEEGTLSLSAENEWKGTFDNLRKYGTDGNPINYTVEEIRVDGYTSKVTGSMEEGFVITNTLQTGSLIIKKTVKAPEGTETGAFSFTITGPFVGESVSGKDGSTYPVTSSGEGTGTVKVEVAAGGSVTLTVPAGTYTVAETGAEGNKVTVSGHDYTVSPASQNVTVETDDSETVTFTNTIADHKEITVTKTWDDQGNKYGLRPEPFAVTLTGEGKEYSVNNWSGTDSSIWSGTVSVPAYDADGVAITYTVTETTDVHYTAGAGNTAAITPAQGEDSVELKNSLKTGSLTFHKIVKGLGEEEAREDTFKFTVTAPDGVTGLETSYSLQNDGNMTLSGIPLGAYTVTETGTEGLSQHVYKTSVDGKEEKETTVTLTEESSSADVTFTNTAQTVNFDLSAGLGEIATKTLNGRAMRQDEFSFAVTDKAGTQVATGSNLAANSGEIAAIDFDGGTLTFTKTGIYTYVITEQIEGVNPQNGIAYDTSSFKVQVTVSEDENGGLKAKITGIKKVDGDIEKEVEKAAFVNEYSTMPTSFSLSGTKELTGRPLEGGDFTFEITQVADDQGKELTNDDVRANPASATVLNNIDGQFTENFSFSAAGTYYFKITERNGGESGMIYDGHSYVVAVQVTDNGNGTLAAKPVNDAELSILFKNTYEAKGSYAVKAKKTLKGRTLNNGEFNFTLTPEGSAPMPAGQDSLIASNDVNGNISFNEIPFTQDDIGKTYTYTLKEAEGNLNGVTYDQNSYTVTVTVKDAGNGKLAISQNTVPEFVNTFDHGTTEITGTKTWLDGNNESNTRPEKLTLTLYANGNPVENAVPEWTKTENSNKWMYRFTNLKKFTETGDVINYTVQESLPEGSAYELVPSEGYNFTNRLKDNRDVTVSGTKTWVDPEGTQHENSSLMLTLKRKTKNDSDWQTVSDAVAVWKDEGYSFSNLDRYDDNGYAYEYDVEETKVEGYEGQKTGPVKVNGGNWIVNFTNTIEQDKSVVVAVTKKWVQPDNMNHPAVKLQLTRDGDPVEGEGWTLTLPAGTNKEQSDSFKNLPKYAVDGAWGLMGKDLDGHAFNYSVEEVSSPELDGYTSSDPVLDENGVWIITNTIKQDNTVSLNFEKIWVGPPDTQSITVNLLCDREKTGEIATLRKGTTEGSFIELPKYAVDDAWDLPGDDLDGHEFVYSISEESVEGYEDPVIVQKDGTWTITNTISQVETQVKVTKEWDLVEGETAPAVTMTLYQDSVPTDQSVILTGEKLSHTFTKLPKYAVAGAWNPAGANLDGHEFKYTVQESAVPGYTTVESVEGTDEAGDKTFTFTNKADTRTIKVTKSWQDGSGRPLAAELIPKEGLVVSLNRNGNPYPNKEDPRTLTLNKSNNWTGEFTGLPTHDAQGKEYSYSVTETVPEGFTADSNGTVSVGADGTAALVNRKNDDAPKNPEKTAAIASDSLVTESGIDMVEKGGTVTYTISWYNHKNTPADVTITDTLPAGVSFVRASEPGTEEKGVVTWNLSNQQPFTGGTVTVTVQVDEVPEGRTLSNTANVFIDEVKQSSEPCNVTVADPSWTITKAVEPADAEVEVGKELTYTVTVTNTGNVTLKEEFTDEFMVDGENRTLPLELKNLAKGVSCEGGTLTLPVGATATFEAKYTAGNTDNILKNVAAYGGTTDEVTTSVKDAPAWTVEKQVFLVTGAEERKLDDNAAVQPGNVLKYQITIANTGNVTIEKEVEDTFKVDGKAQSLSLTLTQGSTGEYTNGKAILDENESIVLEAVYTVGDTDSELVNAVQAGDPSHTDTVTTTVEDTPKWSVEKRVSNTGTGEGGAFRLGERVRFEIVVSNDGNMDLTNVTVAELLDGAKFTDGAGYTVTDGGAKALIEKLAKGGKVTLYAGYTVQEEDLAKTITNGVTASYDSRVMSDFADFKTEAWVPKLSVRKTITGGSNDCFKLGDLVTFHVVVKNEGNLTISDIDVTDELTKSEWWSDRDCTQSAANISETLAPGAQLDLYTKYTVTEADILAGRIVNTAVAAGTASNNEKVRAQGAAVVRPVDPNGHLTITKDTTSTPANGTAYELGETITYEITATNDGNLTLTDITVTDELTNDTWPIESLAPGGSETFTASYVVTEKDILAGHVLNEATATGTSPDPEEPEVPVEPGEDDEPTQTPNPSLYVEKKAEQKPGGYKLGEKVEFTITVKNNGNVTISDITVADKLTGNTGEAAWPIDSLAPGASETFTASYVVTEDDILAGKIKNVATAAGKDPEGQEVSAEGSKTADTEDENPRLKVTKRRNGLSDGYELNAEVIFHVIVENTGNLTISELQLTDSQTGSKWWKNRDCTEEADIPGSLAPGAQLDLYTKYVVTEDDILAGKIENIAEAEGIASNGNPVNNRDNAFATSVEPNGHLTVTKATTSTPENGKTYALGEMITYSITATNDGNLTLTNITVTDELTGNNWPIVSLAPGASETFTAEYVVTEADILAGSVVNVATATGTSPDPDEPEVPTDPGDTEDPTDPKNGHLTVTKTTTSTPKNGTAYALGETITYSITATNDGNLTLTGITVTDELTGNIKEKAWTIDSLEPGASQTFTAEYTVTEADILAGSVKNVATATGTSPDPDEPEVPTDPGDTKDPTDPKNGHLTIAKTVTSTPKNGTAYALGETITYSITATNDGNLTLTDITVTDELTGNIKEKAWTIDSLEPGESETFTAEYTVTEADILAGSVKNVATATGTSPDPEKPEVPVDPGEKEDPTEKLGPSLFVEKTAETKEGGYAPGDTITYTITVTNNGNVTVNGITVSDPLTGDTWTEMPQAEGEAQGSAIVLKPNDKVSFTATYTVTEEDIIAGEVKNVATATGTDPDGGKVTDSDDETIKTVTKNGHLTVTKTTTSEPANGETYALGETITYEITATNDGNLTLTDITVTDELTGNTGENAWTIESLEPGASETFTATYTVTEADILAGSVKNVATATGTSPDPDKPDVPVEPGEKEDPTDPKDGHLTVTKTTTSEPANGETYALGETITYEITATNDGNLTLTGITVTDELTGNTGENAWTIESLEPGASKNFTATYTVTEADILAGSVKNVATATGTGPDPDKPDVPVTPGEKEDPTDPKDGHLTVTKTTTSTPANGTAYALGETITYEITATNDGNLTLTGITVTDELTGNTGENAWTIESLAPGESETFEASYVVTEADILAGSVLNVATATGTSPDPEKPEVPVDPGEKEDPTETPGPSLFVEKTAEAKEGGYALGDTITYTITVTNNGNVTVSDITVSDPLTGDTWTEMPQAEGGAIVLEPGDTVSFTAEYTVTEEDILAGRVENTATATGTDPNGGDVTDSDDETVTTEPKRGHLTITKTTTGTPANGTAYVLGETITYRITATNDGNLTLTNVVVTDELTGNTGENAWTIASLAPGASQTFTAEYVVTEADILAGSVVNVATAAGTSPDPEKPEVPVEPGEKEDPTEPKSGHVTVTKTTTSTPANGTSYALGETITYQITATNDGNLTLTNVVVTDELTGNTGENAWTIASLAPGASQTFTATYTVTEADILAGGVVNVATAAGTSPDPERPEVPVVPGEKDDPTEPQRGHVTVAKTVTGTPANGVAYIVGETVTYQITATNDGNLTLTNVVVTDELTGNTGENAWTIASLAPGASQTFTAVYTVTAADAAAGSVQNIATAATTLPNGPADPENPNVPEVPVTPGQVEVPVDPGTGTVTVTKSNADALNGEVIALPNAQFRVALFSDAALTQQVGAAQTISFGENQAAASATFSGLNSGVYYVAEVDGTGAVITAGEYDGGQFAPGYAGGQQVTVAEIGGTAQLSFTNNFLTLPAEYYRNATLTITKQVRDASGKSMNSNETFYAGIFADPEYTVLADNVVTPIVALSMGGRSSVSESVEVTVPNDGESTVYVTEVTADGTPVENSASFAYDVTTENAAVTLVQDASAETVIVNTAQEEMETSSEPGSEAGDENEEETGDIIVGENGAAGENPGGESGEGSGVSRNTKSVKTGDETPVMFYLTLLLAAALVLILAFFFRRKRSKE